MEIIQDPTTNGADGFWAKHRPTVGFAAIALAGTLLLFGVAIRQVIGGKPGWARYQQARAFFEPVQPCPAK